MTRTWDYIDTHPNCQGIWTGHRSGDPYNMDFMAGSREDLESYLDCGCYFDHSRHSREYPMVLRKCATHNKRGTHAPDL